MNCLGHRKGSRPHKSWASVSINHCLITGAPLEPIRAPLLFGAKGAFYRVMRVVHSILLSTMTEPLTPQPTSPRCVSSAGAD